MRYKHPSELRALTSHEAARIQGFPDYFDFSASAKRAELATMVGNAVPPALMREVASAIIPALVNPTAPSDCAILVESKAAANLALAG